MAAPVRLGAIIWALALTGALTASSAVAVAADSPVARHACAGLPVDVAAADRTDVQTACDGAAAAIGFMAEQVGVETDQRLLVEIVPALPATLRDNAMGCYVTGSRRVMVLTYAAFMQRETWFGVSVDRRLHRAAVAHEVAHALVGCAVGARTIGVAAHEYVAYAAMFATMTPELREQVLGKTAGDGFERDTEINAIIFAFDPDRFGANAWRHWSQRSDRRAFLRRVIDGKELVDVTM